MVNKRSRAGRARKHRKRSRLRLILTDHELEELDRAVAESGALFRSLLIAAAIYTGLAKSDFALTQQKRCRQVAVWVPKRLAGEVKQVATTHSLTQQTLLRHFLFSYLACAPWKTAQETSTENESLSEVMAL